MTREEAIERFKSKIKLNLEGFYSAQDCVDNDLYSAAIEALTRMEYVQETIDCILNTCKSDQIADIAMRNAAKFVQNAIDGECPDFEEIPKAQPCEDAISRDDALLALTGEIPDGMTVEEYISRTSKRLRALLSVQPERVKPEITEAGQEYCRNCIHSEMCSWYGTVGCEWAQI